jgi:hypothetical protein
MHDLFLTFNNLAEFILLAVLHAKKFKPGLLLQATPHHSRLDGDRRQPVAS